MYDIERFTQDTDVQILLAGCDELRESQLKDRFGAATPAQAVQRLLLPGEVADLSREVEKLCGFRMNTLREVKND